MPTALTGATFCNVIVLMPRETVELRLSSPTYEEAAKFMSHLSYPDPVDGLERERFWTAQCRWLILERAKIDKEWRETTQAIKPAIFFQDEKHYQRTHRRGIKLLRQRIVAADYIILPHMPVFSGGLPAKFGGFAPTVNNMAMFAAITLGMREESASTFKSRIWGPSKPVAHAAMALYIWGMATDDSQWEKDDPLWTTESQSHRLFRKNPIIALSNEPDFFRSMIECAEEIRVQLPNIRHFRRPIRESDTIQFKLV
jgi:hypothetical protein